MTYFYSCLKAEDLELSGLHNFKVKNLHVLRHIGLRDIRVTYIHPCCYFFSSHRREKIVFYRQSVH